ncbi:MAG: hypothetical protein ACQEWW_22590 [Bacillota bacterium]
MKTIKLSLEELIFSFYSEGLYEQGIQLKDTFFSELNDRELQMLLEIASRSLMAKDMIREINGHYKLKEEFSEYVQILSHADLSVQISNFSSDLTKEEALSIHIKDEKAFAHEVHFDQQVHTISRLSNEEAANLITGKLSEKNIPQERTIVAEMSNDDFEKLLEEVSLTDQLSAVINQWTSHLQTDDTVFFGSFLVDLFSRKSKLNTMMLLSYDKDNNPDVTDLCFVVPGKQNDWVITRNQENRFNLERASKDFLESFIPSSIFKMNANSF